MYLEPLNGPADHKRLLAQLSLRVACFSRGPPRFLSPGVMVALQTATALLFYAVLARFQYKYVSSLLFYIDILIYIMIYLGETEMKEKHGKPWKHLINMD